MPQMTPAQARVIDPVLTTVARGYKNSNFVGNLLFPVVPVGQRGGKIIKFGKEHFRLYETRRAPGATIGEIQFGYAGEDYSLEQHALEGKVPIELIEEANAVPGIDLGGAAVRGVQDIIGLRLEYAQAALARDAAKYDTDSKLSLTGNDKWSDPDSDPIALMALARATIRQRIGRPANVAVFGPNVIAALKTHPKVLDRIKYTGRDVATLELLASLFELKKVESGDAVYADADDAFKDVWGNDVVVSYSEIGSLAQAGTPSYGYTYQLRNHPMVKEPYWEDKTQSWHYPVFDEVKPVMAGPDAGFLIADAV